MPQTIEEATVNDIPARSNGPRPKRSASRPAGVFVNRRAIG